MLDIKKLILKIVSWSGLKFTWDITTENTTDTWIPVINNYVIQHRLIPTNARAAATKVGYWWTGGDIYAVRRGNCCVLKLSGAQTNAVSGWQTIATIPEGFRPPEEIKVLNDGSPNESIYIEPDGSLVYRDLPAGTRWGTATYPV